MRIHKVTAWQGQYDGQRTDGRMAIDDYILQDGCCASSAEQTKSDVLRQPNCVNRCHAAPSNTATDVRGNLPLLRLIDVHVNGRPHLVYHPHHLLAWKKIVQSLRSSATGLLCNADTEFLMTHTI